MASHLAALAQSDHRPIRATVHTAGLGDEDPAVMMAVASLNVLERCRDGLATYVGALPHVRALSHRGRSEAIARLTRALSEPSVVQRQQADVVSMVANELEVRGSLAVCLQEVGAELLAAVRAAGACARPPWHVHASRGADEPPESAEGGGCSAGTCIVCTVRLTPEEDVVVVAGRGRRRAFAAASIIADETTPPNPTLTIVAVHVLHDVASQPSSHCKEPPTNEVHIRDAEAAIVSAFGTRLAAGGQVLAIGDWNGPPLSMEDASGGVRAVRAWPAGPTQYGTPHAIDGAVLWSLGTCALTTSVV